MPLSPSAVPAFSPALKPPAPSVNTKPEIAQPSPAPQSSVLSRCLQRPVLGGNRVEIIEHGRPAAGAVFDALESAHDHINIDGRLFDWRMQGDALAQRLIERSRAGVRVSLLVDGSGPRDGPALLRLDRLRRAGVKLCAAQPPRNGHSGPSLDEAPPLIVIDGRLAFVGGLGLQRAACGTEGLARVEGPVVAELQWLFMDHWDRLATKPLSTALYFPPLRWIGTQRVGIAAAAPDSGRGPYLRASVAAVAAAQSRVRLSSPLGLPPAPLQRALATACARGVDTELLWSSHALSWPARLLARWHARTLARAGVRVHEMPHRALRARSSVIDGVWSSVGPSWCERVERGGTGMHMIVIDAEFGQRVEAAFRDDAACCLAEEPRISRGWHRIQLS